MADVKNSVCGKVRHHFIRRLVPSCVGPPGVGLSGCLPAGGIEFSVWFFAIGMAISQVLSVLHRKPYLVQYDELVELRDTKGNILLDETGKPQLKREKRYELLEPRKEDVEKTFEVSWKPKHGLVLKFGSREKQLDTPGTS